MQPEMLQGTEHPALVAGEGQDKLGPRNTHEGLGSARRAAAWAEGNLCPSPALGPSEVLRMRGMDQGRSGSPHCKGRSSCHKRTQGWGRMPGSALPLLSCHQSHAGTQAEDAQVLASSLGHILHPSLVHSDHGSQAAESSPSLG